MPELLFVKVGSFPEENFGVLEGVKFVNDNKDLGIFTVMAGAQRGVTFEKSDGVWKIDLFDEGAGFAARRMRDQERITRQYGGAKKFIEMAYGKDENYLQELKSRK